MDSNISVNCFNEITEEGTRLHFQIIHLDKQIYAWVGCNSAKLGHIYAAAPTRPMGTVSVASVLGGSSDNTGSTIARRLALKTGLNIILACNVPKNNPVVKAHVEKILVQKLIALGYTTSKLQGSISQ